MIICLLLMAFIISACSNPENPSKGQASIDGDIICEVFYRPDAGMGLEAAPQITFTGDNDLQERLFETMTFESRYQDDEFEGRTLSIAVINPQNGAEITRQLYQFDPLNPVENQFIGGHGFTGLNYVFQTDSSAEMQFFCSLK